LEPLITGECQVLAYKFDETERTVAYLQAEALHPGDVFIRDLTQPAGRQRTFYGSPAGLKGKLPEIEVRAFSSPEGYPLQGWLILPPRRERLPGPLPLLVAPHGGTHGFVGNIMALSHFYWYVLASQGWAVLCLNPTGSGSYGMDFAHRLRGKWGVIDSAEIISAIDQLVREGTADPSSISISGYSYGGFLTVWLIGVSDRFKAAVVGAPITNVESFYGTSDIGIAFTTWELNEPSGEFDECFRRHSPLARLKTVRTPTLILQGEADVRCPVGQSTELFTRLLTAGDCPCQLVTYAGADHRFISSGRPSQRLDYIQRLVDWVERYGRKDRDEDSRHYPKIGTRKTGGS
jgi:dipeptidyl aminopeptidase/acylaminoacyl peptidase